MKIYPKLLPILLALLLHFAPHSGLQAQDSLRFLSATTDAAAYQINYHQGYVYAGTGSTFSVWDATNPNAVPYPQVFKHRFRSQIDDIILHDGELYISANHDGISKWDISNPAQPSMQYSLLPDMISESAYDISFYGDSLLVAMDCGIEIVHDNGTAFNRVGSFGGWTFGGIVRGGEVRGDHYIAAVSFSAFSLDDGIYVYDIATGTELSHFNLQESEPEEIILGQNNGLVHVAGGTFAVNNLFVPDGNFYSLDVSNPANPTLVYQDTLAGYDCLLLLAPGFSVGNAWDAVNINDTIYVATQGAVHRNFDCNNLQDSVRGHIYVYDATDSANVQPITTLDAGLYHFDLAVENGYCYIASEWFGIKTLDIHDLFNPIDLGNTLTGGWNTTATAHGDTMIVGNENYGLKKYDISDLTNPVLVAVNEDKGFNGTIEYSADGQYLYGCYLTGDYFRIFDAHTFQQVSGLPIPILTAPYGHLRTRRVGQRMFALRDGFDIIDVIDVTTATNPIEEREWTVDVNDIAAIHAHDFLLLSNNDSLSVYDDDNGQALVTTVHAAAGEEFHAVAVYGDTIFADVTNKGLVRYILTFSGSWTLVEDQTVTPIFEEVEYMAADSFGLYLGYREEGLYSYDKATLTQKNYYRTGLGFVSPKDWGMRDLITNDNRIFTVEYFAQTSILSADDNLNLVGRNEGASGLENGLTIFPNPVVAGSAIYVQLPKAATSAMEISVYDMMGKKIAFDLETEGNQSRISTTGMSTGMYIVKVTDEGQERNSRLIIQ